MASQKYQCSKCGKVAMASSAGTPPSPTGNGKCPATPTGNHIFIKI